MEEGVKWNKPGKGTRDGICEYLRWTRGKKKYISCVCVCVCVCTSTRVHTRLCLFALGMWGDEDLMAGKPSNTERKDKDRFGF